MSLPAPYSEVYEAGTGAQVEFPFGNNFKPISAGLVKCKVYFSDGYETVPTYTVDMTVGSITISALTAPDGTILTAPPIGSTVRIYRDEPEAQNVTASQLQAYTAKQLEIALDAIVAMIQEVSYTLDHKTVRLTEPQRDIALQQLSELEDGHLIYWDNTERKLVVTNYPQQDVVRCVNGLFFRLRTDPDTHNEFLQWSVDNSNWNSINVDAAQALAQSAYDLADDAYNLAFNTRGELNAHKADHANPHETSMTNLIDTDFNNLVSGQFLQFDGIKWKNVNYSAVYAWGGIGGNIDDQADLKAALDGKVSTDGSSIMTGPLKMRATSSFQCAIAPYWDGVGFFKLNDNNSVTLMASIEYNSGFEPATTNTYNIGALARKWKNLYLAGKAYMSVINNGYDIAVPVTAGADTFALVNKDINPLQQQINHLQTIGRFLSFWNATTGLAQTNPQTSPYVYQTGDYFRIGVVATGGGTNYKPSGSSYTTGVASTVVETEPLSVGQVYYYDGTNWALAAGGNVAIDGTTIVFNSDNELQAVATVNQNTAAGATNPVFNWVGTLAEYQAQNIETLHPDWLCYITDDVSGGESVYTKAQVDSLLALKVSTGHEVIEFQEPTAANNYTWYRKYADGWVEQGGYATTNSGNPKQITLPLEMANIYYNINITSQTLTDGYAYAAWNVIAINTTASPKTNTEFYAQPSITGYNLPFYWQVSGMAA